MTLGCTLVCGTATLEDEKILSNNLISIGFGMNRAVAIRRQRKGVSRVAEIIDNFNPDSVLRCAFRKRAGGSR
jgi:hypothetical protein